MQGLTELLSVVVWTLFFASRIHECAATPSQDYVPQGFFFDFNPPGTTVPIPVTQQCDTLHITWGRGSAGEGENPTSPYFLQIFASTFVVPIVVPAGSGTSFDFQVPWIPGTQYQICMVDSRGVSGGCQDIYTVIPNANATVLSTCQNVTYPSTVLSVDAAVINGAFSQYGWVPQCTDIQVEAKNGTPPYTLMVGPTLHTPVNITTSSGPMNYTVTLSHGISFFISVTDSQGNGWTQGPLHSGDGADTSCLDIHHSASSNSSTNVPITVGATVGGIVVGLLAGALGLFASRRLRGSRNEYQHREDLMRDSQSSSSHPQPSRGVTTGGRPGGSGLEYIVEPFAMPSASSDPSVPLLPGSVPPTASPPDATSASGSDPQEQSATSAGRRQNVYVVHHDGGRAPVTVYTEGGAEVVELPPRYPASSTSDPSSRGESETTPARESTQRRREPGTVPRKGRGPRSPP